MEVLIHVGVDTVAMNGDGFTALVQEGQKVKAGETLLTFDRTKIAAAQHPDVVVVLVTNSDDIHGAWRMGRTALITFSEQARRKR